jgi:GTP-binding protein
MTRAVAGDIVSIAGFANSTVGHILNHPENNNIIKSLPIEPPMISIQVLANNSPLGGQEGTKLTAQVIKEFLI